MRGVWIVIALLAASVACGQTDERQLIEASVRVEIPGAGGSGVAIAPHLIATNSHVVDHKLRNDITITDIHGETHTGQSVAYDKAADIALVWVRTWRRPHVRFAPVRRAIAGTVRLFGWGSNRRLATGRGQVIGVHSRHGVQAIECSVSSVPGDSGGGLFDEEGNFVALNWGGDRDSHYSFSTPAEYVRQVAEEWVVEALPPERWQEYQCLGGRCGSGPSETAGNARGVAPPKWPVAPPQDYAPPPKPIAPIQAPTAPVQPVAPAPTPSPINTDHLVSSIVEKLATDERFRGPAGPAGKDGRDGKDGTPGKSPDVDQIVTQVLAKIDLDAIAARVPRPDVSTSQKVHYVVVGDDSTNGWSGTMQSMRYAQSRYRGIVAAAPPANYAGQLPALVKYTDRSPEYVARGKYEVDSALAKLASGQSL